MATVASLPVVETTVSFTLPVWIYDTASAVSPWVKIPCFPLKSTDFLPSPMVARNAWRSKSRLFFTRRTSEKSMSLCLIRLSPFVRVAPEEYYSVVRLVRLLCPINLTAQLLIERIFREVTSRRMPPSVKRILLRKRKAEAKST
jgi:hypothetical protein